MSLFNSFYATLGLFLLIVGIVAAWLFRSATTRLAFKMLLPAAMVLFACIAPAQVRALMGFPLDTDIASLPEKAELIAFVPTDEEKRVDIWLREGDAPPRSYEIEMSDGMKKTLRGAQTQLEMGNRVGLMKSKARRQGYTAFTTPPAPYELDPSAFAPPSKEQQ